MLKLLCLSLLLVISNAALAVNIDSKIYGKLNLSYDTQDEKDDRWFSNASRIGVKGDYEISRNLQMVYPEGVYAGKTR